MCRMVIVSLPVESKLIVDHQLMVGVNRVIELCNISLESLEKDRKAYTMQSMGP